jgi:uncharacterized protein
MLVDAGPLIALFNRRDRAHDQVKRWFAEDGGRLWTTWPVLTEVCHLIPEYLVPRILRWIDQGGLQVAEIPSAAAADLADLTERYADRPMDLADASLVWLGEARRIRRVLTLDHADFAVYRDRSGRAFDDLLLIR